MSDSCSPSKPGEYPSDCDLIAAYRNMATDRAAKKSAKISQPLLAKAKDIKLLLLDVDGVLTDGTFIYSHDGQESKSFHTQDGLGLRLLREAGVKIGIITARKSAAVARRGEELKVDFLCQGARNKLDAYKEIIKSSGLKPFEISYMGDDWLDLVILKRVGLSAAPANAVEEIIELVNYTTELPGGHGAVREICDLIITAKGLKNRLFQQYMNDDQR